MKLTLELVREMRERYGSGWTQGRLCKHYGVTIGTVGRIVRGESWQDGAGERMPTQAESEGTLRRLLAVQAEADARREFEEQVPDLVTNQPPVRSIPLSPLDGGDAPETQPVSASLQERAKAMGLDLDKELAQ